LLVEQARHSAAELTVEPDDQLTQDKCSHAGNLFMTCRGVRLFKLLTVDRLRN